jgi:hypothetical protein
MHESVIATARFGFPGRDPNLRNIRALRAQKNSHPCNSIGGRSQPPGGRGAPPGLRCRRWDFCVRRRRRIFRSFGRPGNPKRRVVPIPHALDPPYALLSELRRSQECISIPPTPSDPTALQSKISVRSQPPFLRSRARFANIHSKYPVNGRPLPQVFLERLPLSEGKIGSFEAP